MNDAGSHSPPDLSPAPLVPEATPESDVPAAPSPSPAAPPNAPINASPDHPIDLTTESEAFDGGIARGSPREGSLATSIDSEPALELAAKEKDIPSPAPTPIVPPDGGLTAWLAVASAFFLQFAAIGLRDSMGVYQRYFTLSGTFPGSSSLSVSFIGSIAAGVWAGVGPLTSYAIAKIGFRRVAFCGGVLFYVAYTLASFANALWVLYITQGAMVGVAFAFCCELITRGPASRDQEPRNEMSYSSSFFALNVVARGELRSWDGDLRIILLRLFEFLFAITRAVILPEICGSDSKRRVARFVSFFESARPESWRRRKESRIPLAFHVMSLFPSNIGRLGSSDAHFSD